MKGDSAPRSRRDLLRTTGGLLGGATLSGVAAGESLATKTADGPAGATGGELLVDLADGRTADEMTGRIERAHDVATVVHANEVLGYVAVEAAGDADLDRLADALAGTTGVVHVERNERTKAVDPRVGTDPFSATFDAGDPATEASTEGYEPNDALFDQQYALRKVDAPKAWETTTGGDVDVAILDTGVWTDHPELAGQVQDRPGRDFVNDDDDPSPVKQSEDHGTRVAGTLAAHIDNGSGTAGVCDATLFVGRVLDADQFGVLSDLADGIQWAVDQGADVVNMSVQFPPSKQVKNAVDYARSEDVVLVAASGNDGDYMDEVTHPAQYDGVLAVGATDRDDELLPYSQTGPNLSVVAPGKEVLAPSREDGNAEGHRRWNGTSAATPIVTGAAVLVLSTAPDSTAADVRDLLVEGAEDVGLSETEQGGGLVNAANAIDLATASFPDVVGHPFQTAIETLVDEGVISGYGDGTFRPERALTRAEFASMIANAFDLNPDDRPYFSDIRGHWAEANIRTVAGAGFFGGYPDGTFRPDQNVLRVEVIVALANGLGYSGGDPSVLVDHYDDARFVPDWARQAVADAHAAWGGIANYPDPDELESQYNARRADAAKYVYEASRNPNGVQALTSGATVETVQGSVDAASGMVHEFVVGNEADEVRITLSGPEDGDLDLYVTTDGRAPTTGDYDHAARSYGSREELVLGDDVVPAGATLGVLVSAYSGGGEYELRIEESNA